MAYKRGILILDTHPVETQLALQVQKLNGLEVNFNKLESHVEKLGTDVQSCLEGNVIISNKLNDVIEDIADIAKNQTQTAQSKSKDDQWNFWRFLAELGWKHPIPYIALAAILASLYGVSSTIEVSPNGFSVETEKTRVYPVKPLPETIIPPQVPSHTPTIQ